MFSYLQLPFLQALGYAIANSIWQIALLWLIVILVNSIAKHSSHVRYVTALSAQVAGFVWFLTTLQFYYRHCHAASIQAEQLADGNTALYTQSIITGNDNLLSFLVKAEETLPYLSIAYLILLSLLAIKWIQNFRYTKQLSATGLQQADNKWQSFVNEMADRLDIMQEVKIYLSSVAKSPLTIGYLKPIILLPVASINHLSTEQMEAVLLHELAHIKRADYIINMLVSITEIILFFNPFTRLLSRTIQKERENCCDDWVLQHQYNAAMYAEALLRIACLQQAEGFYMSASTQKKGDLLQRVKRMVQPVEKKFSYKHQVAALLVITGLLFSIAWLQPNENVYHQNEASNIKQTNQQVLVTPLIAQVDNPFFNGASLFSSSLQEDVNKSLAEFDKTMADSFAKTGVQQAQIALQKAAPAVLSTISSGNWQKIVSKATEEATKSLQNIDWKELSENVPQLIDSSFILQSVNAALAKEDRLNEVKAGFAAAKEQLAKLQQDKSFAFNFNTDYLRQLSTTALASLQNFNFKALEDSAAQTSEMLNDLMRDQKKQQEELKTKQQEWLKKIQKNKNKKTPDVIVNSTMPDVPAPPPLPPNPNNTTMIYTSCDAPTAIADATPSVTDDVLFSEPVFNIVSTNKTGKTIHIISNGDSSTINIVIEIRQ